MASFLERARARLEGKLDGQPVAIKSVDEQTKDDKDLVSFVRGRLDEIRQNAARTANEGVWLTNIAYLCGFDSVYFDNVSRQFKPIHNPNLFLRRNRVHVNRILPTIQNRLARLTKSPPRYDVRPKTGDDEDKDAARLGKQVLMQLWDTERINQKRLDLLMWVQQCGHAYMKVCWDPTKGNKLVVKNERGDETLEAEGDLRIDICSAFEVYPDPLAKRLDEAQYIIQAKVRPLSYFKSQYEKGYLVKEEDCWLNSVQYELRVNSFNNVTGGGASSSSLMQNAAIELSYYERPSKTHPFGRHIITASGVMLKDGVLAIDEIPFVKFDDVKIGGKFYSESIVTHLRPIQDQYNRIITMRANWANKLLAGKYITAKGSGLTAETINDQSGEVLEYNPVPGAGAPQAMTIPVMPQYAYQEAETLEKMMYDIAGINEVSRGQLPSAGIPAIGMSFLMEQDDTRIGIVTEQHEHSWAQVGKLILMYIGTYYKMPRLLKSAGKNLEYTVRKFTGEHLRNLVVTAAVKADAFSVNEAAAAPTMGTLTLNGTTGVVVSTSAVTATSRIFLTTQAPGGTPSGVHYVDSRSAGVSFTVKSVASDTSTVAWMLVEPA